MVTVLDVVSPGPAAALFRARRFGCRVRLVGIKAASVKAVMAVIGIVGWCGNTAGADAIKLSGFWIENVSIQGIEYGNVVYFNRVGTELTRPIERVEGIRLTSYPSLGKAQQAIDAGDDRAALQALLAVQAQSRGGAAWVGQWVSYLLVGVYDRLEMPAEAVAAYLALADAPASSVYLRRRPTHSLKTIPDEVKLDLKQRAQVAMQRLAGRPEAALIQELLNEIEGGEADSNNGDQGGPVLIVDGGPAGGDSGSGPAQPGGGSGLTLPGAIDVANTVTQLLLHHRFEQALAMVDENLEKDSGQMAMRLYQRGLAQMYLAEARDDRALYLDAGLSFARVMAYFPHSDYAGPSMVEAGLIHSKIGRPDTADKLYQKASAFIDAEADPRYASRLDQLKRNDLSHQDQETNSAD